MFNSHLRKRHIQYSLLVGGSRTLLQVVILGTRPLLSLSAYEFQNLSLSAVSQCKKERAWRIVSGRFIFTRPQLDMVHSISHGSQ